MCLAVLGLCVWFSLTVLKEKLIRHEYPLAYTHEILELSARYDLDPYLLCAIIKTESDFDKDAVSSVGAIGLMQIMPETGKWLWHKLDRAGTFTPDVLYEPYTNLEMGSWYFSYLFKRYHGQLTETLTAYNAGQGKVDAWLQDERYSKDGKTLSDIPGTDAAAYAGKVCAAYEIYKEYYQNRLGPVPDVGPSFDGLP